MSRAGTTKGSKEKTKATVPQTPVIITEIVKGKFSENDWQVFYCIVIKKIPVTIFRLYSKTVFF